MSDKSSTFKSVDRAVIAADPVAALVGYLSTILATCGVFNSLGLNADQVVILCGAVLGLAATLRIFYEHYKRQELEELKRSADSLAKGNPPKMEETSSDVT